MNSWVVGRQLGSFCINGVRESRRDGKLGSFCVNGGRRDAGYAEIGPRDCILYIVECRMGVSTEIGFVSHFLVPGLGSFRKMGVWAGREKTCGGGNWVRFA